ncbi:MAG: hypothetical protein ABI787_08145 [Spartobacteria bacterium]
MPRSKTRFGKVRPLPSPATREHSFSFRDRLWNAHGSGIRRTAVVGFILGGFLGCLFGAIMDIIPSGGDKEQPDMLSVNARTGKPQLHIKGKPEIK